MVLIESVVKLFVVVLIKRVKSLVVVLIESVVKSFVVVPIGRVK